MSNADTTSSGEGATDSETAPSDANVSASAGEAVALRAEDIEKTYGSRFSFTRSVEVLTGASCNEKCGEIDDPERSPEEKADEPVASDLDHRPPIHCSSTHKGS